MYVYDGHAAMDAVASMRTGINDVFYIPEESYSYNLVNARLLRDSAGRVGDLGKHFRKGGDDRSISLCIIVEIEERNGEKFEVGRHCKRT